MNSSSSLDDFLNWAASVQRQFVDRDVEVTVTLCRSTSNRAAYLEIAATGRIGRLTYWSAGSASEEILAFDGRQVWVNDQEHVLADEFGREFNTFLGHFEHDGPQAESGVE